MKYEELKFKNKETEKKDRELFNKYYNNGESLKGMTYEQSRRKAFDFLNDNNVSVTTINGIMEHILYWAQLLYDDYIRDYIIKNRNEVQPQNIQGWEVTLDVLLDP